MEPQLCINFNPCQEIWKPIPEWPYEVSSLGRIRHVFVNQYNWISRPFLMGGKLKNGYRIITLVRDLPNGKKQRKCFSWHWLVASVFLGPTPPGMEIDHIDDNPSNCAPGNLQFLTASKNILKSVARGHRGENRWNAKLTEQVVRNIRALYGEGNSIKEISSSMGLNFTTVYHVVKRHNWKHIA